MASSICASPEPRKSPPTGLKKPPEEVELRRHARQAVARFFTEHPERRLLLLRIPVPDRDWRRIVQARKWSDVVTWRWLDFGVGFDTKIFDEDAGERFTDAFSRMAQDLPAFRTNRFSETLWLESDGSFEIISADFKEPSLWY